MDPLHVHLYINHLPIFGTFLGALVLILALWRRSEHTEIAAYFLFIVSAVGAVITYLTGEGAEETVEHIQGISKSTIERHEDFSVYPLILLIVLGIASVVGIILIQKKYRWAKRIPYLILILSVISFGFIGWTGYLGGQIRHTEINSAVVDPQGHNENEHGNGSVVEVQLNNGAKWQADLAANQAIKDLPDIINSPENETNGPQLKDTLMGRINRLFKECTMQGEADKQLHHFMIPLINKINELGSESAGDLNARKKDILSYLNTYHHYFE